MPMHYTRVAAAELLRWLVTHGVNLAVILAGAIILVRTANLAIGKLQSGFSHGRAANDLEWKRRTATLGGILRSLVTATVGFVAILMVLRELSIDVVPILTGAGIAGLAIGFGAQNLVRDVISGFFLILEDQVRTGDFARINGVAGTVEQINLRTIVVRDDAGAVQVFPNGTITALANLSKQFAYAVVDIKIPYPENLDRVLTALGEIGASMEQDVAWASMILEPIEAPTLESLVGGGATVRIRCKTPPLGHAKVADEFRRRILTAFAERGIRLSSR